MSAYGAVQDYGESNVVVALASCHQGQMRGGVDHSWIGLTGELQLQNGTFVDFRDARKFTTPIKGSVLLSKNIAHALRKKKELSGKDAALLCLGGDHTISLGTIMATRKENPSTRIVWIDAHPDINCPETSLSGNCHGMPVAHLMDFVDGFDIENPVKPHEIVYIGLRSIDDAEAIRLDKIKREGALIYHTQDVKTRGIHAILDEINSHWSSAGATTFDFPIHVSLDIDSMDPEFTPATGTPVPNGIHPEEVKEVLRWSNARAAGGICHLDVVEMNPYLASAQQAAQTINTTQDVMRAWISSSSVFAESKRASQNADIATAV